MTLNGIDFASYQKGLDPSKVPGDFYIVKATQGTTYINPDFHRAAKAVLAAGKLLGIYHYAAGGSQIAEADFFLKTIAPYIGRAALWLDWESDENSAFGRADIEWTRMWLNRVRAKTGITAGVYMSKSVCRAHDWSKIAKEYPLWCAQYADKNRTGYQTEPWTDNKGFGAWVSPTVYQYSSHGRLSGWEGDLDLDISYMDRAAWEAMAAGGKSSGIPFPDKTDTELAVEVWAGVHGNDDARLQSLGIRAYSVQGEVDRLGRADISVVMPAILGYIKKHGAESLIRA